ncbi:MAG: S41 family peptidase [Woeseiaceae bacterium]|nr:S41 family peptidase [Woeseiaceae bacterium]
MSLKTRGILVLVIGTVMGLGLSLGGAVTASRDAAPPADPAWEQARLFAEVMERVKRDYVEPLDDDALLESAIRGMVADLDTHSEYLDAREYRDIRASTSGNYNGVGVEVSTRDDQIRVVAPIDNSPAQRAGLHAGDTIVAIDGASVAEDGLRETIRRLRGRPGTRVSLTVVRQPGDEVLVFDLRRDSIHVASVRHEMLESSIGYVRISQFTDGTAAELTQAIDALVDTAADSDGSLAGLVVDLRNNPGGILDAAVDVSDLFLDAGVIVSADGRTPESRFVREAHGGDLLDGAPMVVLVNKGSASAAEIVAGALQDHRRALVVGTSTFGKGLVQTVMPLSRGRAIKLTTSRYYTPSGDSIHETGIAPDVYVEGARGQPGFGLHERVDRDADEQLTEALERLRSRRVMHSRAL